MKQQDYLDVAMSSDCATFERRLVKFAHDLDFGFISAALAADRPGRSALFHMIGNTPEAFLQASRNIDDARRDPVIQRLKRLSVPFIYDQALYVDDNAGDLWEEQARFGYRTGIAMALHLPEGQHFLLGVDRPQPLPESDEELTRLMADLQLLAVYAQETAVRLLLPEAERAEPEAEPARPEILLTPREREILHWTSEGKSAWAVAQILALSQSTVNFHLRNAMLKLDVSSKHRAVLKAMSMGLL